MLGKTSLSSSLNVLWNTQKDFCFGRGLSLIFPREWFQTLRKPTSLILSVIQILGFLLVFPSWRNNQANQNFAGGIRTVDVMFLRQSQNNGHRWQQEASVNQGHSDVRICKFKADSHFSLQNLHELLPLVSVSKNVL